MIHQRHRQTDRQTDSVVFLGQCNSDDELMHTDDHVVAFYRVTSNSEGIAGVRGVRLPS